MQFVRSLRVVFLTGLLAAAVAGCGSLVPQTMALRGDWPRQLNARTELVDVPFFSQTNDQCGPSALATALAYSGVDNITAESLSPLVYVPGRGGSMQAEMLAAGRRFDRVAYLLRPSLPDLLREVAAGTPVVVLQSLGIGDSVRWHYAVVVGYDYERGDVYLRSGEDPRQVLPLTVFELTWRRSNYWAMVLPRPGQTPATATEQEYATAAFAMSRVSGSRSTENAFKALVQRWPSNVAGHLMLAEMKYADGDLSGSATLLQNAATIIPASARILNNLAQTLSDLGRNEEAAQVILRIALEDIDQPSLRDAVLDTKKCIDRRLALNA